ncbi:hypothetical protein EV378_6278 [Pseudonocardia endophytica]|uniref:Uncharacterized protein n=1 Tax=Pseudonocardia endophytica TaxID=401976 RepID=A0A4R1HJ27_PSEEN|nr:hypothetical protein EV378_6278 [Pseudonocardia endophytica]
MSTASLNNAETVADDDEPTRSGVYLLDRRDLPLRRRHGYRIKGHYAKAQDPSVDDAIPRTGRSGRALPCGAAAIPRAS